MSWEQEIEKFERQAAGQRARLEEARAAIVKAAAEAFRERVEGFVQAEFRDNAERAQELGVEGTRTIKNEIAAAANDAEELAEKHFAPEELWRHRLSDEGVANATFDPSSGYRVSDRSIYDALHLLYGEAATIAARHDLIDQRSPGPRWSMASPRVEDAGPRNLMFSRRSNIGEPIPDAVVNAVREYQSVYSALQSTAADLIRARRKQAEQDANKLWDDA